MLSEQQILATVFEFGNSAVCENGEVPQKMEYYLKIAEAQHKADQEEFQKQKQEMLKEIDEISFEPCPYQSCYKNLTADECFNGRRMTENCEWWTVLKHKWGIE